MIKVADLAFGRLTAPDLDAMEQFLTDFGMSRADRTKTALYMRGTDPDHHIHVTELGDPGFVGLAFNARSEEDLEILSQAEGASPVEDIDEPGAGKRVRMTDPNGFQVEVIWGQDQHPLLPVREVVLNTGTNRYARVGDLQRLEGGPSHVRRSAHCVIKSADITGTNAWYQKHFGLVTTDEVYAEKPENLLAIFNHIDADEGFVDHHVFLTVQGDGPEFNHLSFEVEDFDDLQSGHHHLKNTGRYTQLWGIGRHLLGSQIFDYWRDPWGRIHEHWTDSDMVNNKHVPVVVPAEEGLSNQWGPEFPEEFLEDPSMHVTYGR